MRQGAFLKSPLGERGRSVSGSGGDRALVTRLLGLGDRDKVRREG